MSVVEFQAARAADTQSQPTQATNLGQIINPLTFAERLAKSKARDNEIIARISKKYELDAENDRSLIFELNAAEKEIAYCRSCDGQNCKLNHQQATIRRDEKFGWYVSRGLCKVGELQMLERKCGKCRIPKKYAGKTFLASIIAQEFIRDHKSAVFGDVPSLLDEIKRTFDGEGNAQEVLGCYCDCDLLVLDDMGAGQVTEWNVGQIYQIINQRYSAGKSTIITSNFDLECLGERLAGRDKYSAKRITSRLSEMCTLGFLGTMDRRKLK